MTATPPESARFASLFVWIAEPVGQPEHIVMVLVTADEAPDSDVATYRPLLSPSEDHARRMAPVAQDFANAMGIRAVLRQYDARTLNGRHGHGGSLPYYLDIAEPPAVTPQTPGDGS